MCLLINSVIPPLTVNDHDRAWQLDLREEIIP